MRSALRKNSAFLVYCTERVRGHAIHLVREWKTLGSLAIDHRLILSVSPAVRSTQPPINFVNLINDITIRSAKKRSFGPLNH